MKRIIETAIANDSLKILVAAVKASIEPEGVLNDQQSPHNLSKGENVRGSVLRHHNHWQ
jgi:hypothetical protein